MKDIVEEHNVDLILIVHMTGSHVLVDNAGTDVILLNVQTVNMGYVDFPNSLQNAKTI